MEAHKSVLESIEDIKSISYEYNPEKSRMKNIEGNEYQYYSFSAPEGIPDRIQLYFSKDYKSIEDLQHYTIMRIPIGGTIYEGDAINFFTNFSYYNSCKEKDGKNCTGSVYCSYKNDHFRIYGTKKHIDETLSIICNNLYQIY